jgi:hypothetical protein
MTLFDFTLFGETYYVRFGFWLLCVPFLIRRLFRILAASRREGTEESAVDRTRTFRELLLLLVFLYWAQGVYDRATPDECNVKGPSPYGLYDVQICITGGRPEDANTEGFVRLRSTIDGRVLAEKDFHNPEFGRVNWNPDEVSVGLADGNAVFDLPPTLLDRIRAKFP